MNRLAFHPITFFLALALLILFISFAFAAPGGQGGGGGGNNKGTPPAIDSVFLTPAHVGACDAGSRDCDTITILGSDLRDITDPTDVPVVSIGGKDDLITAFVDPGTAEEVILELTPTGNPGEGTHRLIYANAGGSANMDFALAATLQEQVCEDFDGDGIVIANGDCNDNDASVNPQAVELCDGIDNNCNFIVDVDAHPSLGQSCTSTGLGACATQGIMVCSADGTTTECNAVAGSPNPETCNGIDDDCDGVVDGGSGLCPEPPTGSNGCQFAVCLGEAGCGVGFHPDGAACTTATASAGICQGGECQADCGVCYGGCEVDNDGDGSNECQGDCNDNNNDVGLSFPELCDGLDNDCDGSIDEEYDLDSNPNHCGRCNYQCQPRPNAFEATCEFGFCGFTCDAGFLDCDGFSENGCEVNGSSCP